MAYLASDAERGYLGALKDSNYAQNINRAIQRDQFLQNAQMFMPLEDFLLNTLTPDYITRASGVAQSDYRNYAANQQAITERQLGGLGVSLSPQEQQAMDRRTNISQGLGQVDAANRAAMAASQRQSGIMGIV